MANSLPSTDIVFIDTLNFSVNIGYDCWGKDCAHPVGVSVYLHLQPNFLHNAGQSDDVTDSVHYGHLTKSIGEYFKNIEQDWSSFNGVDALIEDVAEEGFKLGGAAVAAVHVVLSLPKFILLADGFEMDAVVEKSGERCQILGSVKVSIKDVVLPVLIGVNPPEREAKQRVVTNIIVYEPDSSSIDYQGLMDKVTKEIASSSFLTLEKFVMEIVRSVCMFDEHIYAVTVRAQKPSALRFAQSSGVEITRQRSFFVVGE